MVYVVYGHNWIPIFQGLTDPPRNHQSPLLHLPSSPIFALLSLGRKVVAPILQAPDVASVSKSQRAYRVVTVSQL